VISSLNHPAVKAWAKLRQECVEPEQIELLKQKKKGAVYRLAGVGAGNSTVIAKRCSHEKAVIERAAYEEVLPHLPVQSLHYYGCIEMEEEDGLFWWLFLEDVGDERYSPIVEEQRALAAQWLGAMHTAAEGLWVKAPLPNREPDHYLMYLRSARQSIPQIRAIPSLTAIGRTTLHNIVAMCEYLEAQWGQIETFCDHIPRTFIHGDCLVKNIHVRTTQVGLTIAPFDWGGAGWGLAATDLGLVGLPYHNLPLTHPDYETYWAVVREQWPNLDLQTIQQLANLGQMFWSLQVISRGIPDFDDPKAHLGSLINNFSVYKSVLANTIRSARWED
jgi:hypothetical protein